MAGLQGTGKSTLAARLAAALGGVVLSKDTVRAALFPPPALDYSAAQDDASMAAVYSAAWLILRDHLDPGLCGRRRKDHRTSAGRWNEPASGTIAPASTPSHCSSRPA